MGIDAVVTEAQAIAQQKIRPRRDDHFHYRGNQLAKETLLLQCGIFNRRR
jgi:hypothetical protein